MDLQNKQIIAALSATLDKLPIMSSTALMLFEVEGQNYQQIADTLACPIGTVRSRISRARKTIADSLSPLRDTPPIWSTL
jgi:RNA polymerase sigma-70 factor (ECF subfamily)